MKEVIIDKRTGRPRQAGTLQEGRLIEEIRSMAEKSLYFYAKAILGYDLLTPSLHYPVCKRIQTLPPRRQAYLLPRDHLKTTIAISLCSHLVIQPLDSNLYFPNKDGSNLRILYAGETADIAQSRIGVVRRVFESNELLRAFWPHKVWEDPRAQKAEWNQASFTLPRTKDYPESTFERIGVDGAITGHHFDVIIKDDLIGQSAANSQIEMQKAISWHYISRALFDDPKLDLEYIFGTRWAVFDLYSDMQEKDNVVFYERRIIEGGELIFPERFTMEEVEHLRKTNEDLFYLNYMNTVSGSKLTDFDMKKVREFSLIDGVASFELQETDEEWDKLYSTLQGQEPGPTSSIPTLIPEELKPGQRLTPERYRLLRGSRNGLILKFT